MNGADGEFVNVYKLNKLSYQWILMDVVTRSDIGVTSQSYFGTSVAVAYKVRPMQRMGSRFGRRPLMPSRIGTHSPRYTLPPLPPSPKTHLYEHIHPPNIKGPHAARHRP